MITVRITLITLFVSIVFGTVAFVTGEVEFARYAVGSFWIFGFLMGITGFLEHKRKDLEETYLDLDLDVRGLSRKLRILHSKVALGTLLIAIAVFGLPAVCYKIGLVQTLSLSVALLCLPTCSSLILGLFLRVIAKKFAERMDSYLAEKPSTEN